MPNELGLELTRQEFKFDYSFTTLIFATLALSVQFSPKMGNNWPWLLIFSWILLLVSAILGGIRIIKKVHFLHINVLRNEAESIGNLKGVGRAGAILKKTDGEALLLFKFRQWLFLLGVVFNLLFVANNYLNGSSSHGPVAEKEMIKGIPAPIQTP